MVGSASIATWRARVARVAVPVRIRLAASGRPAVRSRGGAPRLGCVMAVSIAWGAGCRHGPGGRCGPATGRATGAGAATGRWPARGYDGRVTDRSTTDAGAKLGTAGEPGITPD